ncbi:MAG: LysE family translocator [Alphaproteobacteria bacterium]
MTATTAMALALASLVFMASPGPGTFALTGHALAHGFRRSLGFISGMVAGDLMYIGFAIGGMAVIARSYQGLFTAIRMTAALYLIYLGIKAWRAAPKILAASEVQIKRSARAHNLRGFISGLLITLANPKVIMFYVGFLPAFIDLGTLGVVDALGMVGVIIGVLLAVLVTYAAAAERARALLKSQRGQKLLNRGSGSIMIGAGVVIAARG